MGGEYSVNYDTLKQIGKGAFGFVRLAQRKSDSFMVRVLCCNNCIIHMRLHRIMYT